jgi:hypothetical protein
MPDSIPKHRIEPRKKTQRQARAQSQRGKGLTEQGTDKTDKSEEEHKVRSRACLEPTQDLPSEDGDSRGNDVGEQGAGGNTREPHDVVLLGVPGEVIGASKDSDEDVLGGHLMGRVRLYSRHGVARSLTWVYNTDEAINAGRTIP